MRNILVCFLIAFTTIGCAVPELIESTGFRATNYAEASESDALPVWVLSELNKYPIETFLFEVGKSHGTGTEAFENALVDARKRVATRILEQAQHIILSNNSVQYEIVREHYSAVLEHYCLASQKLPALQLGGLSEQNLSINAARTDQYTYALVYIKRDDLKRLYVEQAQRLHQKINRILADAQNAENARQIKRAAGIYLRTYPLYEALKEAEIVQIGAEYAPNYNDALTRLEKAAADTSGGNALIMSHRQVIKRVKEIDPPIIVTTKDITKTFWLQLDAQKANISSGTTVQLEPLTYRHEGLICHFSRDFSVAIQEQFNWHFVLRKRGFKQKNIRNSKMEQGERFRFSGTCWENGDEITIRKTLRDLHTGEFLASTVVTFLNSQLRPPLVLTPPNYKPFRKIRKPFAPRYVTSHSKNTEILTSEERTESQFSPVGGLEVEIWTDKGRDPVYYTQGETMKVFGRVNQPAYLRLLYILAGDRKYTLLQDNYYIDSSQVNNDVEIGEFVCAPPFGAEILIVAARTEKFPSIQTYEKDGYFFLVDQDPELAARAFRGEDTRGMKRISEPNGQQQPDFQHNEAQVVVVTMEK